MASVTVGGARNFEEWVTFAFNGRHDVCVREGSLIYDDEDTNNRAVGDITSSETMAELSDLVRTYFRMTATTGLKSIELTTDHVEKLENLRTFLMGVKRVHRNIEITREGNDSWRIHSARGDDAQEFVYTASTREIHVVSNVYDEEVYHDFIRIMQGSDEFGFLVLKMHCVDGKVTTLEISEKVPKV